MNDAMTIGVGILIGAGLIAFAVALILWTRYGWARLAFLAEERRTAAAERARLEAQRAEIREADRAALGPWWKLVEAIEAAPSGRLQLELADILDAPKVPLDADVDRYLFSRWPGIEIARESMSVSGGIVILWRGRP